MLNISNLHASVEEQQILKGINLDIKGGEVHAIMGPNGSGKSTLASVLAGREEYEVSEGSVDFKGEDLLDLSPEERAHAGLFLAFQYPVEIPGVSMSNFLRTAVNETREARGQEALDAVSFLKLMKEKQAVIDVSNTLTGRSVNEGFSGGEKKKMEIFQMAMLEPSLAILDETDSGLDIDALQVVSASVNRLRSEDTAFMVVTHYERLLQFIVPDYVHIMYDGRIVKTGDKTLAAELEAKGYDWVKSEFVTEAV